MLTSRQRRRRLILHGLLAFHLLVPIVLVSRAGFGHDADARYSDAHRYLVLATHAGTPGRDFASEYPPLALLGMRAIASGGLRALMLRNTVIELLADLALVAMLFELGGAKARLAYLGLAAPLLPFLLGGYDLLVAAVATFAIVLSRRRGVAGGVVLAASAFLKPYTVLFLPVFAIRRQFRALAGTCAALVAGALCWFAWSGAQGIRDVATFRGSRGWYAESVPGLLLAMARGATSRYEGGSWRVGAPSHLVSNLLLFATLAAITAWWWRWRALPREAEGLVALGALALWFTGATLLSPQFIAWMLPAMALCAARGDRRVRALNGVLVAITWLYLATSDLRHPDTAWAHTLLCTRALIVVGIVATAAKALRAHERGGGTKHPTLRAGLLHHV